LRLLLLRLRLLVRCLLRCLRVWRGVLLLLQRRRLLLLLLLLPFLRGRCSCPLCVRHARGLRERA
jgi:hypothetical protein